MPEMKTGPYEILLRFNCEKGETFGESRGVHRTMATYLVDDNNKIIALANHEQIPFPYTEVEQFLGTQYAALNTQLESVQQVVVEKDQRISELSSDLGALNLEVTKVDAEAGKAKEELQQLYGQFEEVQQQLEQITKERDVAVAKAQELEGRLTIDETGTQRL